jgi:hypothetical protein
MLLAVYLVALRSGYVAPQYSPLPPVDLGRPDGWLLDWRIAELAHNRELCTYVMVGDIVAARPVPDRGFDAKGCGYVNAVELTRAGGAAVSLSPLTCQSAAAFAMWVAHVVQPAAERHLGSRVTRISDLGTYACRNIVGSSSGAVGDAPRRLARPATLSQHAFANAVDITGFTLANGKSVSVLKDWSAAGPKSAFLRSVHAGACRFFRVTLGPDANREHKNHFHLDRGFLRSCR